MSELVLYSLVAGLFAGLAAGYMGSLMILKRMALVGDVLSHVALPGIALGFLFHFDIFLGAFAFLFAAVVATWYLERSTRLPLDAVIGVLFVFALAVGILITPQADLLDALFGDISNVALLDMIVAVAISLFIVLVGHRIYPGVILSLISEDLAVSKKTRVGQLDFVYLLLVALVVATGIKVVGSLLVGALVILPAVSAKNVSTSLARYAVVSAVLGAATAVGGIALAGVVNVPPGPLVVVSGSAVFLVTVFMRILRIGGQPARRGANAPGDPAETPGDP